MVANDQPASQAEYGLAAGKYARYEFERKFLLERVPEDVEDDARIYDRYMTGTRLRLRFVEHPDGRLEYKLNQKETQSPPDFAVMTVTSLYLSSAEYDLLSPLPAHELRKRRYHAGGYSIDVYEAELTGLVVAEIEFGSEDEMRAHPVPASAVREVSEDIRYTGGELAVNGLP